MSIELDVRLIKYVEKFPYLYYKGAINYNNELLLATTWKKIGRDLKVSPEYCMNRWKYLRRRFTKEPQLSRPEKEWYLMKYMKFIEPFIHRRKPVDRLSEGVTVSDLDCNEYQNICSRAQWENCSDFSNSSTNCTTEDQNSNSPGHHSAFTPWKQSNDSFCNSLSKALQTLTADQQVRCRIDVLVVIEKYMSSLVGDNSKSTNAVPNCFHSRLDTLAADLSKHFTEIINKISNGSMTSFDEDWLLLFAVKNVFCKLLEMRKANAELDKMLPVFVPVDSGPQNSKCHVQKNEQSDSAPRTSAEIKKPVCTNRKLVELKTMFNNEVQSSSLNPQLLADSAPVESFKIKTESNDTQFASTEKAFQNPHTLPNSNKSKYISIKPALVKKLPESATTIQNTGNNLIRIRPAANLRLPNFTTKLRFSNSPNNSSISTRSPEFEKAVHEALKNLDLTNGFMKVDNRVLCALCDVCLPTEQYKIAHTYDSSHKNFTKDYFLHSNRVKKTALPKLDGSLYIFQDGGGLYCAKCRVLMTSRNMFLQHMKSMKHKNQVRNLPRYIDFDMLENCSIDKEIVPIGSSNYCVLCDVKLFESSPITHISSTSHKKEIALLEGVYKIDRYAYCSFCNEKFPSTSLSIHVKNGKHAERVFSSI